MESLQAFFHLQQSHDIHTIGRYIEQYINEQWETAFLNNRDEMLRRYDEIGDSVYGLYGARLFQPIHEQFKDVRLRATPKLPGNFSISREWGPQDERQRWMWSKIADIEGAALGTIVIVFFHDHNQIRIPRPFQVIALEETTKAAVIAALSRLSASFKEALEAKDEFSQYE